MKRHDRVGFETWVCFVMPDMEDMLIMEPGTEVGDSLAATSKGRNAAGGVMCARETTIRGCVGL